MIYKVEVFRMLCRRELAENPEPAREEASPPPHCEQRIADLYAGADEMGEASGRVAALFKGGV